MRNENFREFAKYASLNTLGMVGLSLYILADTFFISKGLGANGLMALNLALPIYNLVAPPMPSISPAPCTRL